VFHASRSRGRVVIDTWERGLHGATRIERLDASLIIAYAESLTGYTRVPERYLGRR